MRLQVFGALLACGNGLFASCGRVDEPTPPPKSVLAPGPTKAPKTAESAPPARAEPGPGGAEEPTPEATRPNSDRCVISTPEEAPTPARPAAQCPKPDQPGSELARGAVRFVDAPGSPRVQVELARSPEERARGLMYRTHLAESRGMLFSWDQPQIQTFWMHNTCIPLDMLFIARDGTIAGILEQVPTLNERERSVPCPVLHVLEVNAGWARRHGIRAGQKVDIQGGT